MILPRKICKLLGVFLYLGLAFTVQAEKPASISPELLERQSKVVIRQEVLPSVIQGSTAVILKTKDEAQAIVFAIQEAVIRGTDILAEKVKDTTHTMLVGMQVQEFKHDGSETASNLFGVSERETRGGQEIGVASTIRVKNWKSPSGDRLTFESVLAQIAKLHVKKSFEQRTAHLKSWRETTNNQSGIVAPKLSDPLVNSVDGLAGSEHPMDTGAAALSSVSELLRLYTDGRGVLMNGLAGVPDLLSRYTTVSFTVSKDQSSFDESVAQPGSLLGEVFIFEGPSTHLEGTVKAKRLVVLSDTFTTDAPATTSRGSSIQQSGSVSINLLNPLALPGLSYSQSSETVEQKTHHPSSITVEELYVRVKDMVVKGTDIRACVVDAIIENNLTLESLLGLFDRQADGLSLSSSGDMRVMDQSKRLEKIDAVAKLIGTERFYLKVGQTLLAKSAEYGLLKPVGVVVPDGVEHIEAGKIIKEQLQEIDEEHNLVINLPLGTLMTLAGQLNTIQKLKSATFDQLLEEGLTEDEAAQGLVEFQDALDPETKKAIETLEDAAKKVEKPLKQIVAQGIAKTQNTPTKVDLPEGLYEQISGKTNTPKLPEGNMGSEKALPKATPTQQTLVAIADANEKLKDFAAKNPRFAATTTRLVEWGGLVVQAWAYVEAAGAGAAVCSPGGPVASATCAVGAVYMMHATSQAMAAGIEKGVGLASDIAAKQGRTPEEAQRFATATTNLAENLLEGLSLFGLKKGIKSFGKNKPTQPHYDYSTPEAPFSLPIDPLTRKGPMHVDANQFTSATSYTKLGAPRNKDQFWKLWSEKYPETMSAKNLEFVALGKAPQVDAHWISHFPEHQRYLNDPLIHHHIEHGHLTTALPEKLHKTKPGYSIFHNTTGGAKK